MAVEEELPFKKNLDLAQIKLKTLQILRAKL